MVTRVTRDVLDLGITNTGIDINDDASAAFKVFGNSGASFSIDGVPIGGTLAADGSFVNVNATNSTVSNATITNATVTGTLDVTAASVSGITGEIPVGGVILFNAAFSGIPSNFQLCDGTNGTPDMTDQFVYGTNTEGELLDSGGQADAIVPDHTHPINDPGHKHTLLGGGTDDDGGPRPPGGDSNSIMANGMLTATTNITILDPTNGETVTGKNIPPYIKMAFIQRMS